MDPETCNAHSEITPTATTNKGQFAATEAPAGEERLDVLLVILARAKNWRLAPIRVVRLVFLRLLFDVEGVRNRSRNRSRNKET